MAGTLNRYVWVYPSHNGRRMRWEWATWWSPEDAASPFNEPTPFVKTYARNGVRYTVHSSHELPDADALQIVRSLYEYEFATSRIK